jgi:hypothetical protein
MSVPLKNHIEYTHCDDVAHLKSTQLLFNVAFGYIQKLKLISFPVILSDVEFGIEILLLVPLNPPPCNILPFPVE